jgi:hypothetical protein
MFYHLFLELRTDFAKAGPWNHDRFSSWRGVGGQAVLNMLFMTVGRDFDLGRLSAGRPYTSSGPKVSQHCCNFNFRLPESCRALRRETNYMYSAQGSGALCIYCIGSAMVRCPKLLLELTPSRRVYEDIQSQIWRHKLRRVGARGG